MQIEPASNNQLKLWRKLQMPKYRKKENLFIAEGERCVEQVLKGGFIDIVSVVIEEGYEPGSFLLRSGAPFYSVSGDDFVSISDTETPQGMLAVCKIPEEIHFEDLQKNSGLVVAMDAVQDPGNVGTIIRTAAWFDAAAILFGEGTADPFHPKVVRSTAGATGSLPYLKGLLKTHLQNFESFGWEIYLMDGSDDSEDLKGVYRGEKSVIVIGNEGNGISDNLFTKKRKKVSIPGNNQNVESLNAAIALGIGLYRFKIL